MAVDPDKDNLSEVRGLLSSLVRSRRRAFVAEKSRQKQRVGSGASRAGLQFLPEAALPELIWVIANHPDAECDEENGFDESVRYLDFFFDRLLETNDYAAVLNEYLNNVSMAVDATEMTARDGGIGPSSRRISELARIGTATLKKKQSGRRWNLDAHPGQTTLPSEFFRLPSLRVSKPGVPAESLLDVARKYDEDAARSKSADRRFGARGARKAAAVAATAGHTPSSVRKMSCATSLSPPSAAKPTEVGRKRSSSEMAAVTVGKSNFDDDVVNINGMNEMKKKDGSTNFDKKGKYKTISSEASPSRRTRIARRTKKGPEEAEPEGGYGVAVVEKSLADDEVIKDVAMEAGIGSGDELPVAEKASETYLQAPAAEKTDDDWFDESERAGGDVQHVVANTAAHISAAPETKIAAQAMKSTIVPRRSRRRR
jgi:hypothetical protein